MPHFPMDTGFKSSSPESSRDNTHQPSIQTKNRRKRYLDLHPEYFSAELELADPLLYDRLIRRFQSPQEREASGRAKGFSGVLEADLLRSEAKMDALAHPDPNAMLSYARGPDGEILAEDRDEIPGSKEEGEKQWRWEMGLRFLRGDDSDFEYGAVDEDEELDDWSETQERYFEEEEPEWVVGDDDAGGKEDGERELKGETGVQDF